MKSLSTSGQNKFSGRHSIIPWWIKVQYILLGFGFVLLTTFILVMQFTSSNQVTLEVGDVAPRDIRAPARKTYTSQVLTERERGRVELMVRDIYDQPSTRIGRDQIAYLQKLFDYFSSIRQDPYTTLEEKTLLIQTIPNLNLSKATVNRLLDLSPKGWQTVLDQTTFILDQAMRKEIRDNQLSEIKRTLPTLVSLDLTDDQVEVVIALARELIKPNSLYNAEKTAEAKRMARDSVEPVTRTIEKSEIILRAGDIATPEEVEALDTFGLRQLRIQWPTVLGTFLFVLTLFITLILYIGKFVPGMFMNRRDYPLLLVLLLIFVAGVKLLGGELTSISYLFPYATLAILVSVFFGPETAVGASIYLALITGFVSRGSLELATYVLAGSLVASLGLGRVDRLTALLWSGVYITIINVGSILAFSLSSQNYDTGVLAFFLSFGMINGLLSASIALLSLLFLGNLFGKTTTLQLMELARPTNPLLRQLLLKAPGTYHHSLLVSNMAEQAAEHIGANSILARVGAYYHDIGKMLRPYFFVDNQAGGDNVHERLDPQTSAQIVISHVRDGLDLANKYHLPPVIQEFIAQHHGTTTTKYFYGQALQSQTDPDSVDKQRFTYPGPRPRQKEVGIVMLADSCEAAVRAERPESPQKIDELIRSIIIDRLVSGELDDSELTMRDLDMIRASFVNILQGVFHPRIKYPDVVSVKQKGQAKTPQETLAKVPDKSAETVSELPESAGRNAVAESEEPIQSKFDNAKEESEEIENLSAKEKVIRFRRG